MGKGSGESWVLAEPVPRSLVSFEMVPKYHSFPSTKKELESSLTCKVNNLLSASLTARRSNRNEHLPVTRSESHFWLHYQPSDPEQDISPTWGPALYSQVSKINLYPMYFSVIISLKDSIWRE